MENVITDYKVKETKELYNGFIKLEEITISNGDKEIKREVLKSTNSVVGIVYDTVKKKYIFIQQYRAGAEGIMVEVPGGAIDTDEKPEQALKREIMEETGYKVDYLNHVKDFYLTPGRITDITSLFYCEVSERVNDGGGIGDEDISIVEVEKLGLGGRIFFEDPSNPEMEVGVEKTMKPPYQIIDAKTLIAVMWLENSNILKDMADVITQAKIRSL
jgi:nudix-type nucleoside diphosphatase (YffH/AdpP family)